MKMLEICLKLVGCKSKKGLSSSSSCYLEGEYPRGAGVGPCPPGTAAAPARGGGTAWPRRHPRHEFYPFLASWGQAWGDIWSWPGLGWAFRMRGGGGNRVVYAASRPQVTFINCSIQRERGSTIYGCKMSSDLIAEPINKAVSSGLGFIFFARWRISLILGVRGGW